MFPNMPNLGFRRRRCNVGLALAPASVLTSALAGGALRRSGAMVNLGAGVVVGLAERQSRVKRWRRRWVWRFALQLAWCCGRSRAWR